MSKKFLFILVVIVVAVFLIWNVSHSTVEKMLHENEPLANENKCPYKNLNPLRCEPDVTVKQKEYAVLRKELLDYLEQRKNEGNLSIASVYLRDLQNGPILNINEQEHFSPASLLKLPLQIMYYKKAEDDPSLLSEKITVTDDSVFTQNISTGIHAELGKTYTIDDLISLMIMESDNVSWKTLLAYLNTRYTEEDFVGTLNDLGIIDPRTSHNDQYITVQAYASIFRNLYNSAYLSVAMSDKALGVLKKSSFKDGIVAGIPETIPVAHKFGERKNNDEQQLHDCGIVYYPNNPYVLCIMTRGNSIGELETTLRDISQKVYHEVDYRNAK